MEKTIKFIEKSKKTHGDKYDYSKSVYTGIDNNVIIICPEHGEFSQRAYSHISGSNCPKCRNTMLSEKYRSTIEIFINRAKDKHGDKYDYSRLIYINGKTKVEIVCPQHGSFRQIPQSHLSGKGCPICRESKGEKKIREYLEKYGINFESQKRFKDCKDKRPLPFDFYLPKYKCCIEFDGKQHDSCKDGWFGNKNPNKSYQLLLKHDEIKTLYCHDNGIKLIRIGHKDTSNIIENTLNKELSIVTNKIT
jgi:hypothetical protein